MYIYIYIGQTSKKLIIGMALWELLKGKTCSTVQSSLTVRLAKCQTKKNQTFYITRCW